MALSKRKVDSVYYPGGTNRKGCRVEWDGQLPGFGLRVYPSGIKSFVIKYRAQGRQRFMALGQYGVLTVDEARDLARRKLVEVIEGKDPQAEREKGRSGETFRDLKAVYIERHAKPRKRTWEEDERRLNKHVPSGWLNRKPVTITRAEIADLHRKIGKGAPIEANRTIKMLAKVFELAKQWGLMPEGLPNPARGIELYPERKRDRWVTAKELPELAKAINGYSNLYVRKALWLYLLTGVRKNELLRAKWSDVDLKSKELRLPDTKSGRAHTVPLSPEAVAILKELPREEGNPYVIPGGIPGSHYVNIGKAWRSVREKAGVTDVTLHDLRRTVGSWLAQSGNSLVLIGHVLNHSSVQTTKIYARLGEDQARKALDRHGKQLMAVAKKRTGGEVVPIRQAGG
ncbi:MAG: site-specific integrase [Deltaproteobacteria bacterium]|nr:site-specific integrase [Deltaproteobacteria bacterium]